MELPHVISRVLVPMFLIDIKTSRSKDSLCHGRATIPTETMLLVTRMSHKSEAMESEIHYAFLRLC